jgi:outer membrane protein OmpA-like peptidoglycan-associated protein
MYFTTNDKKSKKVGGIIKLIIAEADLTSKGKYKDAKRLPFNSHQYSVCHPALLSDGITMIFASDMPGGFGGMDLYKVTNNNGVWSKPENLGPTVNTSETEVFPYVSEDNVLYFSSDGWGGFGGLDIFKLKLNTTEIPKNLAYPINTNKDDFGYISIGKQHAYLSSNRKHGGIDDDIYYVFDKRKAQKQLVVFTQLKKLNGDITPLDAVKIVLSTNKEEVANKTSLALTPTVIDLAINQSYTVMASHIGLDTIRTTIAISADVSKNDTLTLLFEEEDENILITSQVIDAKTKIGIANAKVYVYDSQLKSQQVFFTDNNGNYTFKGKRKSNYLLKALHQVYFSDCAQLEIVKAKAKASITPLELNKMQKSMTFEVKDLYYDYDKSTIRTDAAIVLDRLVGFLHEYPNIKVELGSHTDARGSDAYNQALSQSRANAAVAYIVSNGIDKNRITAKGYGESQLLNQCHNNVSCTEAEHQMNRRTEIKIPSFSVKENVLPKEEIDLNIVEKLHDFDSCRKIKVDQ